MSFPIFTTIKLYFAGVPGLEPRLTEPESAGLPITPYPKRQGVKNTAESRVLRPR